MIQATKVWWDGEKLMAEPIDPTTIYQKPALAEPDFWEGYVPEPVGAVGSSIKSEFPLGCNGPTGPAQRTWVGLSEEEVIDIAGSFDYRYDVARAAEAKLKEKNNA